jgi:hypothetical protein
MANVYVLTPYQGEPITADKDIRRVVATAIEYFTQERLQAASETAAVAEDFAGLQAALEAAGYGGDKPEANAPLMLSRGPGGLEKTLITATEIKRLFRGADSGDSLTIEDSKSPGMTGTSGAGVRQATITLFRF